jgi:hypothetical protein
MSFPQLYPGRAAYRSDYPHGHERLLVAVFCRVGSSPELAPGLLDTAAEWCVLRADLVEEADLIPEPAADSVLLSRFGAVTGTLARLPLTLVAAEGDDLTVEATCFISEDWPGPLVIGWKGCLERLRFALDPDDESFYFGALRGSAG